MGEEVNIRQMKEFLEFRLDKVENKVDALPATIEALHKEHTDSDKAQAEAIQSIGSKVNLMYKVFSYIAAAIATIFITHYFGSK